MKIEKVLLSDLFSGGLFFWLTFLLIFFFCVDSAFAAENEEIEYLLSYVAVSNCIFIRNGKEHQAKDASEHLRMKYNYAKKYIKTADDFIDKIASKSSITRRKYGIRCENVQLPAEQWLKEALASHRISIEDQSIKRKQ